MRTRCLTSAAIVAAIAAIGLAPVAAADSTVHEGSGNAQIVATPGQSAHDAATLQQPFGGDPSALLFHH